MKDSNPMFNLKLASIWMGMMLLAPSLDSLNKTEDNALSVHASYWLHCQEMKSDIEFVLNHSELLTTLFLGSGAFIINQIMTAHVFMHWALKHFLEV